MKKTITSIAVIAAIVLTSGFTLSAANHAQIQKSAKEMMRQEIIRNITCPDFIESNDPTNQIKAIVEVDGSGAVKVDEINSANPQLKDYVVTQLQNMKLKNPAQSQKFVLVINFQVG